jgi:hypothetical protein
MRNDVRGGQGLDKGRVAKGVCVEGEERVAR